MPRGGAVHRQLGAEAPPSVRSGDVVLEAAPADDEGNLEAAAAGEVVLAVASPETLSREAGEVRRVIAHAGAGVEPLVVVVEAAEELREEELAAVVEAAEHAARPVILRVVRNG